MAFFSDTTPRLRRLQQFVDAVQKDVGAFVPATLDAFRTDIGGYGIDELNKLFDFLEKRHFPNGNVPGLLTSLRTRHIERWRVNVNNAFAVARDSVPESPNPVRAKNEEGNRRSILARLDKATGRGDGSEPSLPTRRVRIVPGVSAQAARVVNKDRGEFVPTASSMAKEAKRAYTILVSGNVAGVITEDAGEFATIIAPAFRGLGLAGIAKGAVARASTREGYLVYIHPENEASLRAAKKTGFKPAGAKLYYFTDKGYKQFTTDSVKIAEQLLARRSGKDQVLLRMTASGADLRKQDAHVRGGRELFAILRTGTKKGPERRQVRIRLVPYLKQLVQVSPRNAQRDFVSLLQRMSSPRGEPALYRVSVGVGPTSCQTCKTLNGRVLTRGALQIATTSLKPVLFHPNCRHRLETGGLQGLRVEDYDEARFGPLVTVEVIRAMIARGTLESQPHRKAFVSV